MQLLLYIHLPAATKDNSPWTTGITHHFSPYIHGTRHSPQGSIKEKVAVEYGYIIIYVLLTVLSSLLEKWDWDWGPSSLVKCCFNWVRITYRFQSRVRYNVFACMTIDWDTKRPWRYMYNAESSMCSTNKLIVTHILWKPKRKCWYWWQIKLLLLSQ